MLLLALVILVFGAVHLVPTIPRAKNFAKAQLGKAYGPIYGLASLAFLFAAVWAVRAAPVQPLYAVADWGRHANFALSLVGFVFVGIFLFRGSWRNRVKYPMGIAVTFWAVGHLLANGDSRTVLFFGGLWIAALVHVFLSSRLIDWTPSEVRGGHNLLSVLFGVAFYGIITQLHAVIAGVPVIDISGMAQ